MTVKSDEYELLQLTERKQLDHMRSYSAASWRGPLSGERFIERDFILSKSNIGRRRGNKFLSFGLFSKKDGEMKAGVELFVRESYRFEWDEEKLKVMKRDIKSGCITSVYTFPENRGKGLAKIMVDEVVRIGRDMIGPEGFIMLYSEIGDYYSRCQFHSYEVPIISIDYAKCSDLDEKVNDGIIVEAIKYHKCEELMRMYDDTFSKQTETKVFEDHKTRISIKPTSDYIDWFNLRSKFLAYNLFHSNKPLNSEASYTELVEHFSKLDPNVFGIQLKGTDNNIIGFILWNYDWAVDEHDKITTNVVVLKIFTAEDFKREDIVLKLINSMLNHFKEIQQSNPASDMYNFSSINIWESEVRSIYKQLSINKINAKYIENSSVPAVRMNSETDNKSLLKNQIIWEENTKLPWG